MNIGTNIFKSTGLAILIFWLFLFEELDFDSFLPIITVSFIPVFICCLLTILFTITPFYWLGVNEFRSKQDIFKLFFPYYIIASFSIATFFTVVNNFDRFVVAFFVSAFITTCQSWVWFAKEKQ